MSRFAPLPLLAALLLPLPALAIEQTEPSEPGTGGSTKTTADLLEDLHGDAGPDRLYAARALKSQLKRALRAEAHAPPGSFASDEARSLLVELEERLPPICTEALSSPQVATPCAEMLALLDVTAAVPGIQAALTAETRKGRRTRLSAALAALQAP